MLSFTSPKKYLSKYNLLLSLIFIIFLIAGFYLLPFYQYAIVGGDLISYISIAKLYATNQLQDAINGYWGPFFSWLMVPFVIYKNDPQFLLSATKLVSLITGFFTLIGILLLSKRLKIEKNIQIIILVIMVPVILYFSLTPLFYPPDILLACILVFYLYFIYDPKYFSNPYNGLICGILGAMAYLTKSYAFPFFIAHFVIFNLLHYLNDLTSRKKIIKNFLLGLSIFLILSGSWALIISDKYGKPTIGTSGEYNHNLVGPVQKLTGIPIWHGFMEPSNKNAISAWDDPSYHKMLPWNPLDSWNSFYFQIDLIKSNLNMICGHLKTFSGLFFIIILIYILLLLQNPRNLLPKREIVYPFLTILIFLGGYIFLTVDFRYFILVYLLIIVMGGYILTFLFKSDFFTNIRKCVLIIIFVYSFSVVPVNTLISNVNIDKEVYVISENLIEMNVHGKIASNDEYMRSLAVSYYLNSQYYGTGKKNWQDISNEELKKDLINYNIDYYIVWGTSANQGLLSSFKEVTDGKIKGVKVYKIKESA